MKNSQVALKNSLNKYYWFKVLILIKFCFMILNLHSYASLKIAYSDWPGWVAWEIGIQKGWFDEEGVDVEFEWLEYVPRSGHQRHVLRREPGALLRQSLHLN